MIGVCELTIEGASAPAENPLPRFGDPVQDRELIHEGFSENDKRLFGYQTGNRVLPYKMQDRYDRLRKNIKVKTIVLENESLRATFLPDYGARLYSLYDKREGRELLYTNKMLQFANLSQRNAWFSGGIEFNFGHYGHSAQTCSPMYAAEVTDGNASFLRFYEYERVTSAFYQMDFHLREHTLDMFVRLFAYQDTPTYWWTNIAVEQTAGCRVFSGTDRVLYNVPQPPGAVMAFAAGALPNLPVINGDCSYPARMNFSCEYFFQNISDPWEAIAYEDGRLFYEASTMPLRYRKMYCWGNHPGGRRWQSFLNAEGEYLEIQAGIAPTQVHGEILRAGEAVEFVQCFGGHAAPEGCLDKEWHSAAADVEAVVRKRLSTALLQEKQNRYGELAKLPVSELLHHGSGWGALELARTGKKPTEAMVFRLEEKQQPWVTLLNEKYLPETGEEYPGAEWLKPLEASAGTWLTLLHLGVIYMESGAAEKARAAWQGSLELRQNPQAWRNLSQYHLQMGELKRAIECMERAIGCGGEDVAYCEEYLSLLVSDSQYQKAWDYFQSAEYSDRAGITICRAALELGKNEYLESFFSKEHPMVREGECVLTDIWHEWQSRLLGKQPEGTPPEIDFRMFVKA